MSIWAQLSRTVGRSRDATPRQPGRGYWPGYSAFDMYSGSVTGSTGSTWGTLTSRATFRRLQLQQLQLFHNFETTMGSGLHLLSFHSHFNLFPAMETRRSAGDSWLGNLLSTTSMQVNEIPVKDVVVDDPGEVTSGSGRSCAENMSQWSSRACRFQLRGWR